MSLGARGADGPTNRPATAEPAPGEPSTPGAPVAAAPVPPRRTVRLDQIGRARPAPPTGSATGSATAARPSRLSSVDPAPHPVETPKWTSWFCLPDELPRRRSAMLRTALVVTAIAAGIVAIAFLLSVKTALLVLAIGLGSRFLCGLLGRIADNRAERSRRSGQSGQSGWTSADNAEH